jgi:hypothetical protein
MSSQKVSHTFKRILKIFHGLRSNDDATVRSDRAKDRRSIVSRIRCVVFTPRRLAIAVFTLVTVIPGLAAARHNDSSNAGQSGGDGRTLEGTWRVEITLRNCATGQPVQNPFPALASFARGGTVTTADGGLSPAVRGTGLGVWWRLPEGIFVAVTEAFLFNGGVRTGVQRIVQEIEVAAGHEEFNARVSSDILDVNGNVVAAGCATSIGRRM